VHAPCPMRRSQFPDAGLPCAFLPGFDMVLILLTVFKHPYSTLIHCLFDDDDDDDIFNGRRP
jgi:hypothetical protein